MSSTYSQQNRLSQVTIDAFIRFGNNPRNIQERRIFYLHYLNDVVPFDIDIRHIPSHLQTFDIEGNSGEDREEVQLLYGGRIFMTGIIAMDRNAAYAEGTAATLAFEHWRAGLCVPDRRQYWGMFAAANYLRFNISHDGREWDLVSSFHPIRDVRDVVSYLRLEYERIRRQ